jgi:phosphate transport system substrate-binding protein
MLLAARVKVLPTAPGTPRYSPRHVVFLMIGLLYAWPSHAASRDRIIIVGSSTVYPFSTLVAEHFAKAGPFSAPIVNATSTAEGFRLFCAGIGGDAPDISNASRPISEAERASCAGNGVRKIAAIRIGYDSLILASAIGAPNFNITLAQLWRAAAGVVPIDGRLVPNPYRSWRDIDPTLPDRAIKLIGPAPGHGTRDAFVELVMEPRCKAALGALSRQSMERETVCAKVRNDGRWTDVDNLELILGKLASDHDSLGILTYSYMEQFRNRIHAANIDGIAPTRVSIPSGSYPMSRPLLIYVKEAHLATTIGLADYAAEFLSFCAAGAHGYLADEGLVPLPMPELLAQRAAVARLQR